MYFVNAMKVSEKTALQAAEWYFRLQVPSVSQTDQFACQAWRDADPSHEYAWQRAVAVSQKLQALPKGLAYTTLRSNEQSGRRRAIKTLAVLMAVSGVSWEASQSEAARRYFTEYSTDIGEQQRITLDEGTEIHLNTASAINTKLTEDLRLIEVEAGEVLIQTGKLDPLNRPMLVSTRFGRLQPLGTRFLVKYMDQHATLAVIEGSVKITTKDHQQSVILANQEAIFDQHAIGKVLPISANLDSWVRGLLVVRDMRLADFASELARYRTGMIRCSPEVADLKISGAFQLHDTQALLSSLPTLLPVKVDYHTSYWVMLSAIKS
ncbi:FecR domain-containing protein [Methylophilus aquaticus]|uniref:FecR domain-containing protein n=1 Tax=Methylophilus aquaticus TaxID=1971610 RepID=A0ABT9JTT6_9PROT|nr:FecR domain-containing protein [Methylophilus aquaticus]MDP8568003.1 FecR domain-containing protein [Methylophilus aquaticus]